MQLGFPTLAVVNGHAVGAGVFLALAHDRAIMESNPDFTFCTNELSFGKAIPYPYVQMLRAFCSPRVARQMVMGPRLSSMKAVEYDLVQEMYANRSDLESKIADFVKQRAPIGKNKVSYQHTKYNHYKDLIDLLDEPESYSIYNIADAKM